MISGDFSGRHFAGPTGDVVRRRLAAQSAMLSALVPRKRWSGLMQLRTSHLWQTKSPSGIGPRAATHAARCGVHSFPRYFNLP
jgi:hypothetical protein